MASLSHNGPSSSGFSNNNNKNGSNSIGSMTFSVRERQIERIRHMLSFNGSQDMKGNEVWKILVYDKFCRDLISPLLKVRDLRSQGVTLHMPLHSDDRQPISDVPAIYFVRPNQDNINRICKDLKSGLYDQIHLNFSYEINKKLLEQIASTAIETDTLSSICKVHDQYLNFISMEDQMFQLEQTNSYFEFHDDKTSESRAEANIDMTVDGLFSVFVTMGIIPIIRCPKGDAAEHVALKLEAKLRSYLSSDKFNQLSSSSSSPATMMENMNYNRPVLLLVDRNVDLSVMISHFWSYQALIHDLLNYNLNRVRLEIDNDGKDARFPTSSKTILKSFDLECSEPFWAENASLPFPTVASNIAEGSAELEAKRQKYNPNGNGTSSHGSGPGSSSSEDHDTISQKTKLMSEYVSQLPEIEEKANVLEVHNAIGKAVLEAIKDRQIDRFFSLEEAIMTKPALNHKTQILELLQNTSEKSGTVEDKLRLFLIYYLSKRHEIDHHELQEYEQILSSMGANLGPLNCIKQIHAINESWSALSGQQPGSSGSSSSSQSQLSQQSSSQRSSGLSGVSGGFELFKSFAGIVTSSVQFLMPANKDFHLTRILDSVMECKETNGVDKYLYLDPKFPAGMQTPRKNTPFKEAIVFTIGGGNYAEMQNIMDYAKRAQPQSSGVPKRVIYGTTEILSPTQFLAQLDMLASSKSSKS